MSLEEYKKKELSQQILDEPDTYVGGIDEIEDILPVFIEGVIKTQNTRYVPATIKLFDEILVNNAALTYFVPVKDYVVRRWKRSWEVNFHAPFILSQLALSDMIPAGSGSIVNISSVHGKLGYPGHSVYASTKGAINSFTKQLSVELISKHIRVNAIAPGTIEVPSYFEKDPSYNREFGNSMVPWGRVGLPEEVGYLAAYLVSDLSEFMTGEIIHIDGGLTSAMNLNTDKKN